MKVEIRNDSVVIEGYVNAVERESKVIMGESGAFTEKIKAGVFQRALERAKKTAYNVKVLLNHDYGRELTSTADAGTKIEEDAIGLRCRCEIRDAEVIEKAKARKLRGWSFGFICLKDDRTKGADDIQHREVRDLDLKEISILDDTKIPAYNGTSIETRSETMGDYVEIRMVSDSIEIEDKSEKNYFDNLDNHEYENRYLATRVKNYSYGK